MNKKIAILASLFVFGVTMAAAQGVVTNPPRPITFSNGAAGAPSGSTYNGVTAATIGSNSIGAFAAPQSGFVELVGPGNTSTALTTMGDLATNCASGTEGISSATATSPFVATFTSAAVGGDCAGWVGSKVYLMSKQPVVTTGIQLPNSADFGSTNSTVILVGLVGTCTAATFNGSTTPPSTCDAVAIRYIPGTDTTYMCEAASSVNATFTATAITGAAPATAYVGPVSITIGASSVTCTVGANSATVSTNLPAGTVVMFDDIVNVAKTTTAVHIQHSPLYGYYQNSTF